LSDCKQHAPLVRGTGRVRVKSRSRAKVRAKARARARVRVSGRLPPCVQHGL
jgi:hypothetical protein